MFPFSFTPKIGERVCAKLDNLEGETVDFVPTFGESTVSRGSFPWFFRRES